MKNILLILLFLPLLALAQDPKPVPYNADFRGYIRVQSLRAKVSPTAKMGYVLVDTTTGQEYAVSLSDISTDTSNFINARYGNNTMYQAFYCNDTLKLNSFLYNTDSIIFGNSTRRYLFFDYSNFMGSNQAYISTLQQAALDIRTQNNASGNTKNLELSTGSASNQSGSLNIQTGSSSSNSQTGNILLKTATTSGTRGYISIESDKIKMPDITESKSIKQLYYDPSTDLVTYGDTSQGGSTVDTTVIQTRARSNKQNINLSSRISSDSTSTVSGLANKWNTIGGNSLSDSTTQALNVSSNFPLIFKTNNTERARFVGGTGRFGIGTTTPLTMFQVNSTATNRHRGITNMQTTSDANGANLNMIKIRNTSAISANDTLGQLSYWGYDGTRNIMAAAIVGRHTGTVGSRRIGGEISFFTNTDDATSVLTQRMVIGNLGGLSITNAGEVRTGGGWHKGIEIDATATYQYPCFVFGNQSTTQYGGVIWASGSSGGSDTQFGNFYCQPTSATAADFYVKLANTTIQTKMFIKSSGEIGLNGIVSPSYSLSFGGTAARTIGMERHSTANTAGNSLTLSSGGATSGATDKSGGSTYIKTGTSTGNAAAGVYFYSPDTLQGAGTTDRTATLMASLDYRGLKLYNNATQWDDLFFPVQSLKSLGAADKPDYNKTELGLEFPKNDTTENVGVIVQMPHQWKEGSSISPHIHFIQTSSSVPVFKIKYRVYNIGETPPAWTIITTNSLVYTYVSGSIHQIAECPDITMSGKTMSCIIDMIIYRSDNVVTGDVLVKQFDIHYEKDGIGSQTEYTKY